MNRPVGPCSIYQAKRADSQLQGEKPLAFIESAYPARLAFEKIAGAFEIDSLS
jgi:hypothetical protein